MCFCSENVVSFDEKSVCCTSCNEERAIEVESNLLESSTLHVVCEYVQVRRKQGQQHESSLSLDDRRRQLEQEGRELVWRVEKITSEIDVEQERRELVDKVKTEIHKASKQELLEVIQRKGIHCKVSSTWKFEIGMQREDHKEAIGAEVLGHVKVENDDGCRSYSDQGGMIL